MSNQRNRAQVLAERQHAVTGGCCNRFADHQACDCLETAMYDKCDAECACYEVVRLASRSSPPIIGSDTWQEMVEAERRACQYADAVAGKNMSRRAYVRGVSLRSS
jgi:hypothetical protein